MNRWINRRTLVAAVSMTITLLSGNAAQAQSSYPDRPLKIIVPLAAGGAADVGVRAQALELEKRLKQPVVVDNKPGRQFLIGVQALLSAPADGYTLLHLNAGMVAVQAVQKNYDITTQLMPLTLSGETPMVLMVNPNSSYKSKKDLLAYARANPGKVNYATPAVGSIEHLKVAQMEKVGGFTAMNVPYKGGGPDMLKAVIGNEVDFTIAPAIFAAQFAPKGMVRVLAAMESTRLKDFPEVPTMAESGVNVSPLRIWGGFAIHPNTPAPIAERLFKELSAVVVSAPISAKLVPFGMILQSSNSADEFKRQISDEAVWMGELVKGLNLQ